jgi:UDP-glucose 4-epimerase
MITMTDNAKPLRVLITGGAGHLGRTVATELLSRGHIVTIIDVRDCGGIAPQITADIRNEDAVCYAVSNVDVVVHAAALHGTHVRNYKPQDFLATNLLTTHAVLEAAASNQVLRFVYISSTSVYGVAPDHSANAAFWVDERTSLSPRDVNDLSKANCEDLCRYYGRTRHLPFVILRSGRFYEDDWVSTNIRKLFGAVDVRDVAQAVRLAVEADRILEDVYCISSRTNFTRDDVGRLINDTHNLLEQRYPGIGEAFQKAHLTLPPSIHRVVDCTRACEQLGYRPQWNFDGFLHQLVNMQSTQTAGLA